MSKPQDSIPWQTATERRRSRTWRRLFRAGVQPSHHTFEAVDIFAEQLERITGRAVTPKTLRLAIAAARSTRPVNRAELEVCRRELRAMKRRSRRRARASSPRLAGAPR